MLLDISIIVTMALITFLTRLFPFFFFGGKRKMPVTVQLLGNFLPPAVMAVLVIYCFKGISFGSLDGFLPEMIAGTVVVLIHIWKRNNLLSIGVGTALYMILVQNI